MDRIKQLAAGGAAVAVLASGGLLAGAAGAANAATTGPGYEGITPWGGALVQYVASGDFGPCADSTADWPNGPTGEWVTETRFVTESGDVLEGAPLAQLNVGHSAYKAGAFGDPNNNDLAAADAAFQYAYTSRKAHDLGVSLAAGMAYVNGNQAIANKLTEIWNYAQSNWDQTGNGATGGTLSLNVDPTNNYVGTASVSLNNPTASGLVKLTNGRFDSTGTDTAAMRNGDVLAVHGVAPDGARSYKISAHGDFTGPGGVKAEIKVASTPGKQRIVTGTGATNTVAFSLDAEDPMSRSAVFQPIATSSVPSLYVKKGDTFKDTYTFATAPDARGVNNPWRTYSDGHYTVVNGEVTVYGPFNTDPALNPQATPPAGAPVAAKGKITTTAQAGPTVTYPFDSKVKATESGYYTSVITLDVSTMNDEAKATLPDGYKYAEEFGAKSQTQIVPSDISFSTKLDKTEVTMGGTVIDTITPALSGGAWLIVDGQRVPVPLEQKVYYSADEIAQSPTVPEGAELIGTYHATLTGPTAVKGEPIKVGFRGGFVTVVTCIDVDAMPEGHRGLVNAENPCDGYGVPDETVKVVGVGVETQAQIDQTGWKVSDKVKPTGPGKVEELPNGLDADVEAHYIGPDAQHVCTADNKVDLDQLTPATTTRAIERSGATVHFDVSDETKTTAEFDLTGHPLIQTDEKGNPVGGIQFVEAPSTTDEDGNKVELPRNPDACNIATEYVPLGIPEEPVTPAPTEPTALAQTGSNLQSTLLTGAGAAGVLALGLALTAHVLHRRRREEAVTDTAA
ncbi:hypothetical protein ACI2IX_20145 [Leifsonia aquatica]|uniref:hypothetical protein n=1 Tax=Leifsonia aquatica TaxID=144185 RepID=UPI00384F78B7